MKWERVQRTCLTVCFVDTRIHHVSSAYASLHFYGPFTRIRSVYSEGHMNFYCFSMYYVFAQVFSPRFFVLIVLDLFSSSSSSSKSPITNNSSSNKFSRDEGRTEQLLQVCSTRLHGVYRLEIGKN